jgi:hypothetical protein
MKMFRQKRRIGCLVKIKRINRKLFRKNKKLKMWRSWIMPKKDPSIYKSNSTSLTMTKYKIMMLKLKIKNFRASTTMNKIYKTIIIPINLFTNYKIKTYKLFSRMNLWIIIKKLSCQAAISQGIYKEEWNLLFLKIIIL